MSKTPWEKTCEAIKECQKLRPVYDTEGSLFYHFGIKVWSIEEIDAILEYSRYGDFKT